MGKLSQADGDEDTTLELEANTQRSRFSMKTQQLSSKRTDTQKDDQLRGTEFAAAPMGSVKVGNNLSDSIRPFSTALSQANGDEGESTEAESRPSQPLSEECQAENDEKKSDSSTKDYTSLRKGKWTV